MHLPQVLHQVLNNHQGHLRLRSIPILMNQFHGLNSLKDLHQELVLLHHILLGDHLLSQGVLKIQQSILTKIDQFNQRSLKCIHQEHLVKTGQDHRMGHTERHVEDLRRLGQEMTLTRQRGTRQGHKMEDYLLEKMLI